MKQVCGYLRKELESCAYTVFESENISSEAKPEFLKTKQDLRADFKEYAVANKDALYQELQNITDPTSRLCLMYSLLEFVGDAFPKAYCRRLKEKVLADYLGMLLAVKAIKKSSTKVAPFLLECMELMLPMALPLILQSELMHSKLEDPDMFNNITTAESLLGVFFDEYKDLEITSFDNYLAWLYQSVFFIYILWHQDCTDLAVSHIEKLAAFIKDKGAHLESKYLLAGNNLSNLQQSLGLMLELDSMVLPENMEAYNVSKPLLFSLVLEPLLLVPLPRVLTAKQKEILIGCLQELRKHAFDNALFSEQQRLDIYIALFSLGGIDEKYSRHDLKSFTVSALIQMVRRIKSEVLLISNHVDCLKHLGFILQQSKAANMSAANAEYTNFFAETKADFNDIFKGAMSRITKAFYAGIDGGNQSLKLSQQDENKIVALKINEFQELFMLLAIYKSYKNAFAPAKALLQEFFIINFDFMDDNNLWRDGGACFSFKEITQELIKDGIKSNKVEFMAIKKALENLIKRAYVSDQLVLTADDLAFWEMLPEVFPAMQMNIKAWSPDEQSEIDEIFLELLDDMSFNEGDSYTILEAKLCISMLDIVSLGARFEFYQYTEQVLQAINSPAEVSYQLPLIKKWLLSDARKGDEVDNSDVLRQVKVFSQTQMPLANRVLYLSQLAELLYLIMKYAGCFYAEEELYSKIAEISEFVLLERDLVYGELLVMGVDPAQDIALGQKFLDQGLITLIGKKMPGVKWKSLGGKAPSRSNSYKALDITNVFFEEDKIVINCDDVMFSLPLDNIPPLNILNAQVRAYKDKYYLCADGGMVLVPITFEGAKPEVGPVEKLSDDQLYSLFEDDAGKAAASGKKKPKNKKKNKKPKSKNEAITLSAIGPLEESHEGGDKDLTVSVLPTVKDDPKPKGVDEKQTKEFMHRTFSSSDSSISLEDKVALEVEVDDVSSVTTDLSPVVVATEVEGFESAAVFLVKDTIKLEQVIKLVQEYFGFKVSAEMHGGDVEVTLGESKASFAVGEHFAGTQKLQQDLSSLPAQLLKSIGADSFASLVYGADGKVVALAPAAALLNHFEFPTIGIKKGKILKSVERMQTAFLNSIQEKLKVMVSITEAKLSMAAAAAIAECDLRTISPDQLWPELLRMHAALLQQLYGGNMALGKIVLDEENKIIAIDLSDYLPKANASLQRVEIQDGSLFEAYEEFFGRLDSASFKFLKNLAVKEVEFILKIMRHADSNLMVYGHPVIEHHYGDLLRALGVAKQPLQQLVVRLDSLSDIDDLRGILTSTEVGAIIKGVKPEAMYCNYQGVRVTVCLGHNYMNTSIFNGDHFCAELKSGSLAYSELQKNPAEVGPTVLPSQKTGNEIFMDNSYALKAALSWHKIMGKLGGGLRQLLQNLGFVSVVTAPELESVTWQKATASKELLPGVVNYLQVVLHLESEEDAAQVLQEVAAMMQGASEN